VVMYTKHGKLNRKRIDTGLHIGMLYGTFGYRRSGRLLSMLPLVVF